MAENIEEQKFGKEGVEQSQDYSPMPMAFPEPPPPEDIDSKDILAERYKGVSAREAADILMRGEEVPEAEPSSSEPISRAYIHYGGKHSGEQMPENQTVPLDRAARDLTGMRESEDTIRLNQLESELISQLDAQRAEEIQSQPPAIPPTEPSPVEQPPPPPEDPAVAQRADKLQKLFTENPELLETVEAYRQQGEQQVAAAQQQAAAAAQAAQQQYAAAVQQNAQAALAILVSNFGELSGLNTAEQLQTAIQTISRTNPDRARQITDYLGRINGLVSELARVADAERAQVAQQFQQYQAETQRQFQKAAQVDDTQFENYAKTQGLLRSAPRRDQTRSPQHAARLWSFRPAGGRTLERKCSFQIPSSPAHDAGRCALQAQSAWCQGQGR